MSGQKVHAEARSRRGEGRNTRNTRNTKTEWRGKRAINLVSAVVNSLRVLRDSGAPGKLARSCRWKSGSGKG